VPPQPTLYLHGAGDGCIGVEIADWARTNSPANVSVEVVTGGGHFVHLEQPTAVNERIMEFLG
jgi:pimeloyl-ACP methyl ester carboxylesterase